MEEEATVRGLSSRRTFLSVFQRLCGSVRKGGSIYIFFVFLFLFFSFFFSRAFGNLKRFIGRRGGGGGGGGFFCNAFSKAT